jgi:hypothetical protein
MTKFLHFQNPLPKAASARLQKRYQSRTVAVESASPDVIRSLAADFVLTHPTDQFLMHILRVGVTFLHPNDNYSKATGREIASKKMEDIPLKVVGVQITPTHVFVKLQEFKGMSLNLRLNKATGFSTVTGRVSDEE